MQARRSATECVKESAANTMASAKAGLEKTKASAKEKAERLTTSDPAEKAAATGKREARKAHAEQNKEVAYAHNEEARRLAEAGLSHPGYKTWGTEGGENYTTVAAGTEGYRPPTTTTTVPIHEGYTTAMGTGVGSTTSTGDPRHPRGPVRGDAPWFY